MNMSSQQFRIYILTFAYAFSTFASGILMPIYAFFVQKIGGGILETSWAIALYSMLCGIGTIILYKTPWSRQYPKQFLWIGWLLWLLSMVMYLVMQNLVVLYLSQILNGIGDAMCEPIFDAEFSQEASTNLAEGWALFNGATSIFSGIASFIGGFIAAWYGFDVLLYCVISIATLSFFLILYYVRDSKIYE